MKSIQHPETESAISNICDVPGIGNCGIAHIEFNWCIVAGLNRMGHFERRYCFEQKSHAESSLLLWNDSPHPPGPWTYCRGFGIDLVNARREPA